MKIRNAVLVLGICGLSWSLPALACEVGTLTTKDKVVKLTLREATAECAKTVSPTHSVFVAGDTLALDIKVENSGKEKAEIKAISLKNAIDQDAELKPRVRAMPKDMYFADNIQFATTGDWTLSFTVQRGKKSEVLSQSIYAKPSPDGKKIVVIKAVPEFSFKDPVGKTISRKDLLGNVSLISFFFASCPHICPMMNQKLAALQKDFAGNANFRTLSITTDPETDTAEKLAKVAQSYKADTSRWFFLRGPKKDVVALSNKGLDLGAREGSIAHSTNFVVVDRDGIIRGSFDSTRREELEQLKVTVANLLKPGHGQKK